MTGVLEGAPSGVLVTFMEEIGVLDMKLDGVAVEVGVEVGVEVEVQGVAVELGVAVDVGVTVELGVGVGVGVGVLVDSEVTVTAIQLRLLGARVDWTARVPDCAEQDA